MNINYIDKNFNKFSGNNFVMNLLKTNVISGKNNISYHFLKFVFPTNLRIHLKCPKLKKYFQGKAIKVHNMFKNKIILQNMNFFSELF